MIAGPIAATTSAIVALLALCCAKPDQDAAMAAVSEHDLRVMNLRLDVARLDSVSAPSMLDTTRLALADSVGVPVFFASTRRRNPRRRSVEEYYLNEPDPGALHYGRAVVSIPAGHRPGVDDGRGWCRYLGPVKCERTTANSVTIIALDTMSETQWRERLAGAFAGSAPGDVLLFVHGFNNDFKSVVHAAGQLSYDVGFRGVTAAFDWASVNSLPRYVVDQEEAERSLTRFKQFLHTLFTIVQPDRVYIVSHSMGTRLVAYALRDLANETPRPKFAQVILAASDIDSSSFVDELADKVAAGATHVTLYASHADRALKASASSMIHAGRRVGSGPPSLILHDGMDYIDASAMDTDLIGHGYYREDRLLLNDMFYILRHGLPAEDRPLDPVPVATNLTYYRFP